jgi:pyridoxine 4-dehydrogenase
VRFSDGPLARSYAIEEKKANGQLHIAPGWTEPSLWPTSALSPKLGAFRGEDGSWRQALGRDDLSRQVHDNLKNLRLDVLDVVNLRIPGAIHEPSEGSIEEPFTELADLQRQGLIRHIGLSNVTSAQLKEARGIAEVVCVQNQYNLAYRADDALIEELAAANTAYVPFWPLGGLSPLQSDTLTAVAAQIGATPMQTALSWLLQRSANTLLIPGTSSLAHLRENLAAAELVLPGEAIARLNAIGAATGE